MCASCAGVTREKLGSLSNDGSVFRESLEGAGGGLLSSARLEIEPFIGDMSPCFVGDDGSSDFISTSASFLTSTFSSWDSKPSVYIDVPSKNH
jgi:hypothetical protein